MPQLDVSSFPTQVFWLVVSFVVLYLLMTTVGLPRLHRIIEDRRAKIAADLDRAARMKAEAEAVMAAYERSLADARAQAQATLKEAMERFGAEAAERQQQAAEKLSAETSAAERRIAEAKAAALAGLRDVAVDVARTATRKLVGMDIGEDVARAAVDGAIREIA